MLRGLVFVLFVASGFSTLLYQVVWLRLAFAAFGIITPVLSIVLSVFMLGLALGSWTAGRLVTRRTRRTRLAPVRGYALAELGIGAGAFVVPALFGWGARALLDVGEMSSGRYLVLSALIIAVAMVGFTILMGATFPLMMAFLRAVRPADAGRFSALYLANVIGAMGGASMTALVLIEALGFRKTLLCGALVNLLVGGVALSLPALARRVAARDDGRRPAHARRVSAHAGGDVSRGLRLSLLFGTGLTALAMEVVWTRAFTPVMSTNVYAFAALLSVYLLATWIGSAIYRRHRARARVWRTEALLGALSIAALLPLVLNDPRWHAWRLVVLASIVPISALLGYLTPRLIDDHAGGDPRGAGTAYAVNVAGGIAGPLIAGYVLLPFVGVKWSLILLALVYYMGGLATGRPYPPGHEERPGQAVTLLEMLRAVGRGLMPRRSATSGTGAGGGQAPALHGDRPSPRHEGRPSPGHGDPPAPRHEGRPSPGHGDPPAPRQACLHSPGALVVGAMGLGLLFLAVTYTSTYEEPGRDGHAIVRRDHTATVVSRGEGMDKQLLVNGEDLTSLTIVTKLMAHLPLVMRVERPRSTLAIGLGMGTTFRSLASWEGRTTAVELVPGVRDAFGFYFADAARVLARPATRIVVDDGRRFLSRSRERFDVITLDPPPPVEAAGSSLLYSVELSRLLRARLSPGGVVQQWLPAAEEAIERAVATSVRLAFPHVKVFRSVEGWGHHLIASDAPLATPTVEQAMSRMPAAALRDLMEWRPETDPRQIWRDMLAQERDIDALAPRGSRLAVTDDRPFNEYFWLRRSLPRLRPALERTLEPSGP